MENASVQQKKDIEKHSISVDSEGRTLTKEQQAYFEDSKINENIRYFVDKNIEAKHNKDAQRGWTYYDVNFGIKNGEHTSYYTGKLNVRMDANGNDYVYDITIIKKIDRLAHSKWSHPNDLSKAIVSPSSENASELQEKDIEKHSIAIDSKGRAITEDQQKYFDTSVVFYRDTIDPKKSVKNKVYGGDAWTPTFPTIAYKVNDKKLKDVTSKLKELVGDNLDIFGYPGFDSDQVATALESGKGSLVNSRYANMPIVKLAYLRGKGIDVEFKYKEEQFSNKLDNMQLRTLNNYFISQSIFKLLQK
ncbi:MAG: hypothetical protein K6B67_05890 [Lachnospiraceae bacterium]|nr:hypothetical protein [Lachnospiraceae bacterium]